MLVGGGGGRQSQGERDRQIIDFQRPVNHDRHMWAKHILSKHSNYLGRERERDEGESREREIEERKRMNEK